MDIILIAATTVDGYIARNNFEVTDWSQDLSLFKKQTMGYPIIMGSHTFKTLPKELHGRKPIIVHRNDDPQKIIENIRFAALLVPKPLKITVKTNMFSVFGSQTLENNSNNRLFLGFWTPNPLK